jgi:hypothetical protein
MCAQQIKADHQLRPRAIMIMRKSGGGDERFTTAAARLGFVIT